MPRMIVRWPLLAALALAFSACGDDEGASLTDAESDTDVVSDLVDGDLLPDLPDPDALPDTPDGDADAELPIVIPDLFAAIPESARFELPCLEAPVHVVRTAYGFPHLFAASDTDLQCAHGFVVARDRYVVMELARRLGLSRLSEVIGEPGLALDASNRAWGIGLLANGLYEGLLASPHHDEVVAYAAGVTAYAEHVRRGQLPAPPLFELVFLILGVRGPEELVSDWDDRAVAGAGATLLWQSSFDALDVSRQRALEDALAWADGLPDAELRRDGLVNDVVLWVRPPHPALSAVGWEPPELDAKAATASTPTRRVVRPGPRAARDVLDRVTSHFDRLTALTGRDLEAGFGSNAWAVSSALTADGTTLLASDGHLPLTTPTTFYNVHLDTAFLGDGDTHTIGVTFPGIPLVVAGTNGQVAFSQTQFVGDLVDWYREELVVVDGVPVATRVGGEEAALTVIEEVYQVSRALGSVAGERRFDRFVTADGRPLFSVEGAAVDGPDDDPNAINLAGDWIVVGDTDGDDVITGLSVAYAGHFERNALDVYRAFGHASSVAEMATSHARGASLGANIHGADAAGGVLYSPYQAMSCRRYLPRDDSGHPIAGADPTLLLDGTRFISFEVTREADGTIAAAEDDERRCMLSYAGFPHALSPERGFVLNSNNDPFGGTFDNDLFNDAVYLGGPNWANGFRARRLEERLAAEAGEHTLATMIALQNDHQASLARDFADPLVAALEAARSAAEAEATEGVAGRLAALWNADDVALDEASSRLTSWAQRDYPAASGVATFYDAPTPDDALDAVATMIFHAWLSAFFDAVFADEDVPATVDVRAYGERTLFFLVAGRGEGNPEGLASWSPSTAESVFFDVVGTEAVESADEVMVAALSDAMRALEAPDEGDGAGGFGTNDPSAWLWGLKHMVRFPSIVTAYVGDSQPALGNLLAGFGLTTDDLPLSDPPPGDDDPRASLTGFPRPGAPRSVDVGGRPLADGDYSYTHGPVFRMAYALGPDGVVAVNVLPGGQSDDPTSDHYGDQATLWLGNETFPLHFEPADVAANAVDRELLVPALSE